LVFGVVTFAQQWKDCRYIRVDEEYYCPRESVTLVAFDLIPFINSLPIDIKSINERKFDYDPAGEILTTKIPHIDDTIIDTIYYYQNGYPAGNWNGSRGRFEQHLVYSKNGKAEAYSGHGGYGGEIYHYFYDSVTYFQDQNLTTYDSIECIYIHGQRGSGHKIDAVYRLKYKNDTLIDSVIGRTGSFRLSNGVPEFNRNYRELFLYSYNTNRQLTKVEYSVTDVDSNKLYEKKLYQYSYGYYGLHNERYFLWIDTVDSFVLMKEATHTYNPQGLVSSYQLKTFDYVSDNIWEYGYDAKKRIINRRYSNPGGQFETWTYNDATSSNPSICLLQNTGKIKVRTTNKSITITFNLAASAYGTIQLFSATGKALYTIANQQKFLKGSRMIVLPMEKIALPSGMYLISISTGKERVVKKVTICK
jgi:hypothetical protein